MSVVKIHTPKVKLASLLRTPGGRPVVEALAAADKGLGGLKDDCLAELRQTLERAEASVVTLNGVYDGAMVAELYEFISASIGGATTCGLEAIDTCLISLADLLDTLKTLQRWDSNAVAVHLRAFRLLLHTEAACDAAGTEAILSGLRKVAAHYARDKAAG